ncbi:MAG: carboxypeptidase-like regulatory domain-containing protein, partial [bacterium]
MDKLKITFSILLAVVLSTAFLNQAQAQGLDVDVHITPDEAEIEIGQGIQLEAFAFSLGNAVHRPVAIDAISYEVTPDSLGTITEDGFFVAGRHVGVVKIKVIVHIGNRTLVKDVRIRIGKLPKPFFDVKVVPEKAVVPTGTEKQFEVIVRTPRGNKIRPENVQWEVKPEDLGKINQEGLFMAGDHEGRGKIVAVVEVDGLRLSAAAYVIVSPPATGAIAGNISSDAGGAIAGAVVKAFRLGKVQWVQRAESDDAGNYLVGNLIPGNYVLYANARGFIGEFYDNKRDYLQAFVFTIGEEDTLTGKDFGLSEGATIAGKVTDESGNPLAGAHVFAALKLNLRFAKHTTSNEDGSYEIGELPTGGYVAAANAPGYQVEFFDDKHDLNAADII